MKCKQKLCSRNKNIDPSGNCVVCENVLTEIIKKFEKEKKEAPKRVDVDFELMVQTHDQLLRGIPVDTGVVSNLLLGGVINILNQHDTIEEMDRRIKAVESSNLTDKLRIEFFEDWTMKQSENIINLDEKVLTSLSEKSNEVKDIQTEINNIKIDFGTLKSEKVDTTNYQIGNGTGKKEISLSCKHCDNFFIRAIDLENHMEEHELEKNHMCVVCGKNFHLKWRLLKHIQNHHTDSSAPYCHYFNNHKECTFCKVGCMFKHELSGSCKFKSCSRKMCQFEHTEIIDISEVEECMETEPDDAEDQVGCLECECTFLDSEELRYHVQTSHTNF